MALTGTLADVGFDELVLLLRQQNSTGVLALHLEDRTVSIAFRDGEICQVDDDRRLPSQMIGQLLMGAGLVDRQTLASALALQRTNSRPLGALLVSMEAVQLSDLTKFLELQYRETIYPLFGADAGSFELDTSKSGARICAPPPINPEDVVLEAARRIDEFPEVIEWVRDAQVLFTKTCLTLEDVDDNPPLKKADRTVFRVLTGQQSAELLVGPTAMSTFDVMKSLARLYQLGAIVPSEEKDFTHAHNKAVANTIFERHPQLILSAFHFVVAFLLVSLLVIFFVRDALETTDFSTPGFGVVEAELPYSQFQIECHLDRLETLLEVYRLIHGRYPSNLTELADAELIEGADLYLPEQAGEYYYLYIEAEDAPQWGHMTPLSPDGYRLFQPRR